MGCAKESSSTPQCRAFSSPISRSAIPPASRTTSPRKPLRSSLRCACWKPRPVRRPRCNRRFAGARTIPGNATTAMRRCSARKNGPAAPRIRRAEADRPRHPRECGINYPALSEIAAAVDFFSSLSPAASRARRRPTRITGPPRFIGVPALPSLPRRAPQAAAGAPRRPGRRSRQDSRRRCNRSPHYRVSSPRPQIRRSNSAGNASRKFILASSMTGIRGSSPRRATSDPSQACRSDRCKAAGNTARGLHNSGQIRKATLSPFRASPTGVLAPCTSCVSEPPRSRSPAGIRESAANPIWRRQGRPH